MISKKEKWLIFGPVSIVIIIGLVSTLYMLFIEPHSYINNIVASSDHKISLLFPLKEEKIYAYSFREGEDFYIFYYDKDSMKKIIKANDFKKITDSNKEEVEKILKRYQNDLCEKERKLFDKTTNVLELSNIDGYYLYINNLDDLDKDYIVCIIAPTMDKIYAFNINH